MRWRVQLGINSTSDVWKFNRRNVHVENVHNYNTRSLATQSYYLPKIRTNYGRFNVRFQGPIVWNAIDFHVESLSFKKLKKYIKQDFISKY
jgi:hypothetical protein